MKYRAGEEGCKAFCFEKSLLNCGYCMEDFRKQFLNVPPANDAEEMDLVEEVFMRMPGPDGSELVFRIPLLPDGTADISQVPEQLRCSWEEVGERLPINVGNLPTVFIKPSDGRRFLAVLLRRSVTTSGVRFSSSPNR